MDKSTKQRFLGGVVLLAGAALFLPLLFDGSKAGLPTPAAIPAKPTTPSVDDLAPKLDQQAAALDKAITDEHVEQTFFPVDAPPAVVEAVSNAADEQFKLVEPAQPMQAAEDAVSVQAVAEAKKLADEKAAQVQQEKERLARDAAAKAALAKTEQDKAKLAAAAAEKRKQEEAARLAAAEKAKQQATQASAKADAWVVQVASLSSKDKADELAAKLRASGYRANVGGGGSAWKVSVGPELNKDVANAIKQRLASEQGLNGFLVAYKP